MLKFTKLELENPKKESSKLRKRHFNEIYSRYEMYSQADGLEQSTFDKSSGISEARSKKIVSWLSDYSLPSTGTQINKGLSSHFG